MATHARNGDATAIVIAPRIVEVMRLLRDDRYASMDMLIDLCAVDHLGRRDESERTPESARFELVYHLRSLRHGERLRVKAGLGLGPDGAPPSIASVCELWPAAVWMEREVWDLYGIRFEGHPDLRRLLLPETFEGHPLRKDFPKRGRSLVGGPGG